MFSINDTINMEHK